MPAPPFGNQPSSGGRHERLEAEALWKQKRAALRKKKRAALWKEFWSFFFKHSPDNRA